MCVDENCMLNSPLSEINNKKILNEENMMDEFGYFSKQNAASNIIQYSNPIELKNNKHNEMKEEKELER